MSYLLALRRNVSLQGCRPTVRLIVSIGMTLLFACAPLPSSAEWYAGGYGGYSHPGSLRNVQLPLLGESRAQAQNPGFTPAAGDTLTSSLRSSDISLKNSGMFGAKGGYFFKDEGYSWLGIEIEAFTTQPTIKRQTVATVLDATYSPKVPSGLNPPTTIIGQSGTLQLEESRVRLTTVAFNVIARYPGQVVQPYVGVGAGAFYFSSSGQIDGRRVVPGLNLLSGIKVLFTEELAFFVEGKFTRATIPQLDPKFGLRGEYSAFNAVAGLAFHF